MSVDPVQRQDFEKHLRSMSDRDIRLALDTGTIKVAWERSFAKSELRARREAKEAHALEAEQRHKRHLLWVGVAGLAVAFVVALTRVVALIA